MVFYRDGWITVMLFFPTHTTESTQCHKYAFEWTLEHLHKADTQTQKKINVLLDLWHFIE